MWTDETVVIIGGGPSLTQDQIDYVKGRANTIGINDAYRIAPWIDILYACDLKWWTWHRDKTVDLRCLKITPDKEAAERFKDLTYVEGSHTEGLSLKSNTIHYGKNGGYQAINLAAHTGAKKIVLIGFDQRFPKNQSHWFGDHPDLVRSVYSNWTGNWQSIVEPLKQLNIEVINCTPGSALTVFPMAELKEVL